MVDVRGAGGGMTVALPTPARQRRGVLGPVLGLIGLAVCGLIVLGVVAGSIGLGGVVVGVVCALLPVAPVVATFLWVDRWEPEPPRLLLFAFLWGACFAALSALLINSGAALAADQVLGRGSGDLLGAVAIAPVVEELLKGLFLVGLLIFRRREFDGIVDGVVYAGLVAAGFAFTENVLYLGRAFAEDVAAGTSGGLLAVLLLRGVLSPFAHPLFTAFIGIGAALAATSRSRAGGVVALVVGYLLAVGLHALWNLSGTTSGGVFYGVYATIMLPLFAAVMILVLWQRRREQRIVTDQLPGFAQAGWIAPSEVALLSSMAGRQGWRRAVRRRSGRKVAAAVAAYQATVTELAFLRARMARGTVGPAGPHWHEQAVARLREARTAAVGHPEALTVAVRRPPPDWAPPPVAVPDPARAVRPGPRIPPQGRPPGAPSSTPPARSPFGGPVVEGPTVAHGLVRPWRSGQRHTDPPAHPRHTDPPAHPRHTDPPAHPRHPDPPAHPRHPDPPARPRHPDPPARPPAPPAGPS